MVCPLDANYQMINNAEEKIPITHFYKKSKTSPKKWNFYCRDNDKWYPGNHEHRCPFCKTVIPKELVKPYYTLVHMAEQIEMEQEPWYKQMLEDKKRLDAIVWIPGVNGECSHESLPGKDIMCFWFLDETKGDCNKCPQWKKNE